MFLKSLRILVASVLMSSVILLLVACGDDDDDDALEPAATAEVAPAAPEPTPTEPDEAVEPDVPAGDDLAVEGKLIFEETAGGVGCASCHGMDGRGDAAMGGPDIRGASASQVRSALGGAVPVMNFIDLSEDELQAVVAYLQDLAQ